VIVANPLHRNLSIVVVVLGLVAYGVSFGPAADGGGNDWHVRFAALAGLAAAIGLLPKQSARPWLTALLAAAGFLDALSSVVTAGSGWVLITIVTVNGLQAVAAVAALWLAPEAPAAAAAGGYEAYLDYYNQAVQQYYQQSAMAQSDSAQRSAYGQAHAHGYAQSHATHQAPQYGDYTDLLAPQQDYGQATAAAPSQSDGLAAPPGRAGAGPVANRAAGSPDVAARQTAP
jgi:hypothetical protein